MSNAELVRIGCALPKTVVELEQCGPLSESVRSNAQELISLILNQFRAVPSLISSSSATNEVDIGNEPRQNRSEMSVAFGSSSEGSQNRMRSVGDRLYGRALRTPTREISDDNISSSSPSYESGLPYQPHNHSTVYSFTPGPFNEKSRAQENPSPQINPDELFKFAGWSSPEPSYGSRSGNSFNMEGVSNMTISRESHERQQQAQEQYAAIRRISSGGTASSTNISSIAHSDSWGYDDTPGEEESKRQGNVLSSMPGNDEGLPTVPESLDEIYEISNHNRKRNKEKKKKISDGEDDESALDGTAAAEGIGGSMHSSSSISTLDDGRTGNVGKVSSMTASNSTNNFNNFSEASSLPRTDIDRMQGSLFDESIYFKYADLPRDYDQAVDRAKERENTERESTLDFVESIGWIKSPEERRLITETYLHEKQSHADSNQADDAGVASVTSDQTSRHLNGNSSTLGNTSNVRRSFDRDSSMNSLVGSGGRQMQHYQQGTANRQHQQILGSGGMNGISDNRKSTLSKKGFDYSRSSQSAVSAFPIDMNGQASGGGGGRKTNYNPYLHNTVDKKR